MNQINFKINIYALSAIILTITLFGGFLLSNKKIPKTTVNEETNEIINASSDWESKNGELLNNNSISKIPVYLDEEMKSVPSDRIYLENTKEKTQGKEPSESQKKEMNELFVNKVNNGSFDGDFFYKPERVKRINIIYHEEKNKSNLTLIVQIEYNDGASNSFHEHNFKENSEGFLEHLGYRPIFGGV